MKLFQIIILYIIGSLLVRGFILHNSSLLIIGSVVSSLFLIIVYSKKLKLLFSENRNNYSIESIISFILGLVLIYFITNGYTKSYDQAIFLGFALIIIFVSIHLFVYKDLRRLFSYPVTWLLILFQIIGITRWLGSKTIDVYQKTSIEKARIREFLQSNSSDWHPPFLGPRFIREQ